MNENKEAKYSGQVTPEELQEVFGYRMINTSGILIDREAPPEQISGIYLPDKERRERQTGSPCGFIIQLGAKAKEKLEELYGEDVKIGYKVHFDIYAPRPAGLSIEGLPILPGFDRSRYACIEVVHFDAVIGITKPKTV